MLAGIAVAVVTGRVAPSPAAASPVVPTRGFSLPRWVDRPDGVAPSQAVLERLREAGFETARLPINPDLVGAPSVGVLSAIEQAANTLLGAGFSVLIDMHPSGDLVSTFASDPDGAARRLAVAWTHVRDVIAVLPADRVYAELLNEPPMEQSAWLTLRDDLAGSIRSTCPGHTLVWGPARHQGIWELAAAPPLDDHNAIAAVHYYTPMGFTHQCETWDASPLARLAHLPFPARKDSAPVSALRAKLQGAGDDAGVTFLDGEFAHDWTVARIRADFATAADWSKANRCPLLLGEFGVLDFCVDAGSRARWVEAVREAAEANGMGWNYWEVDAGFGFIADRQSTTGFSSSMITALVG